MKAGTVLFIGFAVVGAVRLNVYDDRWFRILRAAWLCTAIICTAEASQMIADGRHLWELRDRAGVIDVLCTASLVLVIGVIVGEIRAAWLINVYEAAGMELPPYNQFLLDMEKIVPAVNAKGYYFVSVNLSVSYVQNQLLYNSNDQRRYI